LPPGTPFQDLLDRALAERQASFAVRPPMVSFLQRVIGVGTQLVRGFLGIPARAAPVVTAAARRIPTTIRRGGALIAGGAAFGAGDIAISELLGGGGVGAAGAGGRTVRNTIIVTQNADTGEIIKKEVRRGAPFLMGRDVQIANRVIRMSRKLAGRIPKQAVKTSRRKLLTDLVVERALENQACPQSNHRGN